MDNYDYKIFIMIYVSLIKRTDIYTFFIASEKDKDIFPVIYFRFSLTELLKLCYIFFYVFVPHEYTQHDYVTCQKQF